MRVLSLLATALPALAVAQDAQVPLKDRAAGWFDKAKSYIPSAAPSIPNPIDAGASAVAAKNVEKITQRNWERKLGPQVDGEQEWLLYVTGGNKTCFGRCGKANLAWNQSVPLISAASTASHVAGSPSLHLGSLNCEVESVLCAAWAAAPPAIWHFSVPSASASDLSVPLYIKELNVSSTTPADISTFVSAAHGGQDKYLEYMRYEGAFHPFDGWMAKSKVLMPIGYAVWALGTIPSWAMMIGVSFLSRQVMNRRMAGNGPPPPQAQRPAAAAPAAAAGGKKKR